MFKDIKKSLMNIMRNIKSLQQNLLKQSFLISFYYIANKSVQTMCWWSEIHFWIDKYLFFDVSSFDRSRTWIDSCKFQHFKREKRFSFYFNEVKKFQFSMCIFRGGGVFACSFHLLDVFFLDFILVHASGLLSLLFFRINIWHNFYSVLLIIKFIMCQRWPIIHVST